jgi:hypothetical protein
MKLLPPLALAALLCPIAQARPIIIQETSTIESPDPEYNFGWRVGLDGDDAVVYGVKSIPDPGGNDDSLTRAFLFHRSGNTWSFVRVLAEKQDSNEGDGPNSKGLDMRNGVIAAAIQPLHIFERVNGTYVERITSIAPGDNQRGDYVVVDGTNRIFFGGDCWGGTIIERNADATWTGRASLRGDFCGSTDGAYGGPVALAGEWAVVSNPWNEEELPAPALRFFRHAGANAWPQTERRVAPADHSYGSVYMRGNELYAADLAYRGMWVYRRDASNAWNEVDRLSTEGDYLSTRYAPGFYFAEGNFGATSQLVLHRAYDWDLARYVIHVFKKDDAGRYAHVATLTLKGDANDVWTDWFAIYGNRVLVGGVGRAHFFVLPTNLTAPPAIQHTFASTPVSGWTVLAGSQFALAQSGTTQVWRQSSTAGDAGAVLDGADWTNQSIQAEVKPTAISAGGSDRWVGLMTRRTNPANYYYVTLRASGTIMLKRMSGGTFTTLASATIPWALNRNYRLRLESAGDLHRVYVDGVRLLEARDSQLKHGRAGVLSSRAAADFDNVIVAPAPLATIWAQALGEVCQPACANRAPWSYTGGQWTWNSEGVLRQAVISGDTRAIVGAPTANKDQIFEARVRPATFGTPADPWAGIMVGYKGPGDYVYLSLRKSNTLQLRRLRGGQITQLGSVPINVTPGTWYALRLEQVGDRLRGYVNGVQKFEVVQDQWNAGQVGLVTYAAAADYDDVLAVRP